MELVIIRRYGSRSSVGLDVDGRSISGSSCTHFQRNSQGRGADDEEQDAQQEIDLQPAPIWRSSVSYLIAQSRAGADAVQIFDTSAGVLITVQFERWCIMISFSPGAGAALKRYGACVPQDPVLIGKGLFRRIDSLHPTAVRAAAGKLDDRASHLADVIPQLFFRLPTA
jgi:hypothetical protein